MESHPDGCESPHAGRELSDAGAASTGTPLLRPCAPSQTVPPQQLVCVRLDGASTEGHRHDYVSIMLAVRCLLFAAVCARCAVTGNVLRFIFSPISILLFAFIPSVIRFGLLIASGPPAADRDGACAWMCKNPFKDIKRHHLAF